MKILAFSDWRVQNIDELIDYVKNLDFIPDVITYAGDDVNRFGSISNEVIIKETLRNLKFNSEGFCILESTIHNILILAFKNKKKVYRNLERFFRDLLRDNDVVNFFKKIEPIPIVDLDSKQVIYKSKLFILKYIQDPYVLDEKYTIQDILSLGKTIQKEKIMLIIFPKYRQQYNKFVELAKYSKYGVFAVLGNDDSKLDKYIISKNKKIFDLHEKPQIIDDFIFVGQEGASKDISIGIGDTLYNQEEIKSHMYNQIKNQSNRKIILVSHSPPHKILDTAIRFNIESIGSPAIREFIEKNNVVLNICGHVHNLGGKTELYKNCLVVNIASHDNIGSSGKIAIIEIKEKIDVQIIELPPSDLKAINGIGDKHAKKLRRLGLRTIKDIVSADPVELSNMSKFSINTIKTWQLRGNSLINRSIILLERIYIDSPVIIDIETDNAQDFVWMICIYDTKKNTYKQFTAYNKSDEEKILDSFLDFISSNKYNQLYCYSGTSFEKRVLLKRILKYNLEHEKLPEIIDILPIIRKNLIIPITTYGLKDLATLFGFTWSHPEINGYIAPTLYEKYLEGDKQLIKTLQEYNRDDTTAVWHILQKINNMMVGKYYSIEEIKGV